MNCIKCGLEFSIYGLKQHVNKCVLTKEDVEIIINEYLVDRKSIREIREKYNLSNSTIFRILKNKTRTHEESMKLEYRNKYRKTSNETKKKLSLWRIKYLKDNPDKIKWVGNESKPSTKFKSILVENNISFVEEFSPLSNRFFNIDIAFPNVKIGIEINGEQHYERSGKLKKYYQDRHDLITNGGWKLYEIHTSLVYKKEFIDNLILELKNNFNLGNIDYSFYKKELVENKCLCGENILKKSKNCNKCDGELKFGIGRKVERPTYKILINEIDKFGYKSTGRKYGVAGNTIKKWIKLYRKYDLDK